MNKTIIFLSFVVSAGLLGAGISARSQLGNLSDECARLVADNHDMKRQIEDKSVLTKRQPVVLSKEYGLVMDRLRMLEAQSGTRMNLQLDGVHDTDDISNHYINTEYKGIRGLKILIVVDRFSKETDMGAILDDIYLLERSTDLMVTSINKDNNNLIVKGEIYGF